MLRAIAAIVAFLGMMSWARTQAVSPATTQPGREVVLDLGAGASMKLVLIPAGKFLMGTEATEKDHKPDEGPRHEVRISKAFFMGVTPVTQKQWKAVIGKVPSAGGFEQIKDDNAMAMI